LTIKFALIWYRLANSIKVLSPLIAARATLALKSGEWFLRFLLIFCSSFVEIIKQKITPYFRLRPVLRMGYTCYLNAYVSMAEAKSGIGNWIEYYNHARKHQPLGTTPELMYAGSAGLRKAA
jgi:hypothetical protein